MIETATMVDPIITQSVHGHSRRISLRLFSEFTGPLSAERRRS